MKLADLTPAEYNPRVPLKPGDAEYDALKESLQEDGLVVPLIWNEATGRIVGGHQRLKVLLDLGETEADVSVVNWDEKQERQANIALNKIEGDWDYDKLRDLFEELGTEDVLTTGFSKAEVRDIFPEGFETESLFNSESDGSRQEPTADRHGSNPQEEMFFVYISFPSLKKAEDWLRNEGYEPKFTAGRTMTVHVKAEE